jgi:hypothetical protein
LEKRGFGSLSRKDGRPVVSSLEGERFGVQTQLAFLLFRAVALGAAFLQQGADLRVKLRLIAGVQYWSSAKQDGG